MVRITKPVQERHRESMSSWIGEFRTAACATSLPLLPQHLATFPTRWPFPRGDLYHWVSLLNRFDVILERFCKLYKLDEGPQTLDFDCRMLLSNSEDLGSEKSSEENLQQLGYGKDGDRELVESILKFSRMLLYNCGNRSIYASSSHLNSLLNSTSLSLLESTLLLGSQLAQRYQAAMKRTTRHVHKDLLKNHYNIDLDKVIQLSSPFTKTIVAPSEPTLSTTPGTPATPSAKGKEKAGFNTPGPAQKPISSTICANDLVSFVKGGSGVSSSPNTARKGSLVDSTGSEISWDQWGDVKLTYYPKAIPTELEPSLSRPRGDMSSPTINSTPTRPRNSNLGPNPRPSRQNSGDGSPTPGARSFTLPSEETSHPNYKVVEISSSKLRSNSLHTLLLENLPGLPPDMQYQLLSKLRVASALTTSLETRRQILSVRLLAITNLAYIHPEATFLECVMKQDSDEPRRLQLAYQLAELVHPPAEGDIAIPKRLQTTALSTLDAISQYSARFNDVCTALNTNVNHGVLLYVVRKAVASMGADDIGDMITEQDEWRDALFALLANISINPRTAQDLVTAGLIQILVEVLTLRTNVAERYHPKVLGYLDTIMYSSRDAFQTLVNADGLDTISNLILFEVKTSTESARGGKGMLQEHRSSAVDYEIPFFHQQTLKWLFKFIHHMMSSAGGFGTNFDRLLRNLIDSTQLLGSLRQIIGNSHCFGSIVWTNAVAILNDFINNEPTSFAVIAEAGLSKGFLEAVTGTEIVAPTEKKDSQSQSDSIAEQQPEPNSETARGADDDDIDDDEDDDSSDDEVIGSSFQRPSLAKLEAPRKGPLAKGIMPTSETINIIPQAFGALCLNNAGMEMFRTSGALETFFEIFESRDHVKCMENNKELPSNLGATFDELARHHPPVKTAIADAVLNMVARVCYLCRKDAEKKKIGAKLWTIDTAGKVAIADSDLLPGNSTGKANGRGLDDAGDVEMQDADQVDESHTEITPDASNTPYISAVASFLSVIFGNTTVRSEFCSKGGIEYVLDLASSPCLYTTFADSNASKTLQSVIANLAESKPFLAMPSLLRRAQTAADVLAPLVNHTGDKPFFEPFVIADARSSASLEFIAKGTSFAKAFVNLLTLVKTLNSCLNHSAHFTHGRSPSTAFTQVNVSDYYVQLVRTLGPLLGAMAREQIRLENVLPENWKKIADADLPRDPGFGDSATDNILGMEPPSPAPETVTPSGPANGVATEAPAADPGAPIPYDSSAWLDKIVTKAEQSSPYYRNYRAFNVLLEPRYKQKTKTIASFLQTLGKALIPKRGSDAFQKQGFTSIAEAIAETILSQLGSEVYLPSPGKFKYWNGILSALETILIDASRNSTDRPYQTITIVLQAFKERRGFDAVNQILEAFTTEIRSSSPADSEPNAEVPVSLQCSIEGTTSILLLYAHLVNGKNVTESAQTSSMTPRDRERRRDQFSPPQFLVELRMAVLPVIRRLWQSDLVEKGPSQICEKLIEVIRLIATQDCELGALKRSDATNVPPPKTLSTTFKSSSENLSGLIDTHSYSTDLAIEALYRCSNNLSAAVEYCREVTHGDLARSPVPEGLIAATTPEATENSRPRTGTSTGGTATPDEHAMAIDTPADIHSLVSRLASGVAEELQSAVAQDPPRSSSSASTAPKPSPILAEEHKTKQVTIDDLNEEREAIREDLIDKCLDVINAHPSVTFEIADLITTVIKSSDGSSLSGDASSQRKTVGTTLVIALSSFAGEENLKEVGNKIAAYANLLGLLLREKSFYKEVLPDLKEQLPTLLSFVRLSNTNAVGDESPWIAQVLLVIEILLTEDARPRKTKWTAPKSDEDVIAEPVLETGDPTVSTEERNQLFEAILDILPQIGKDETLAIAVLRILVILTRTRSMALAMTEKKLNIQKLFVLAKGLHTVRTTRIQGPLILILRHSIEDDETIKQQMRSDIKAYFESTRQRQNVDVSTYLRGVAHTAIRQPELFVEVTNEMVKYNRWQYSAVEGGPRSQISLVLKDPPSSVATNGAFAGSVSPTVQATEDLTISDVKPSTEADSEMQDAIKASGLDNKVPTINKSNGVIPFLLEELLKSRVLEDHAGASAGISKPSFVTPNKEDTAMTGAPSASDDTQPTRGDKLGSKQDFKPEEHPQYLHKCFILQCLTELLSSYNSTKFEYIGWDFRNKDIAQPMTPSKPHKLIVDYLLNDLIPIGTLDHAETTDLKKKLVLSGWADSVLTALLSKTGERPIDPKRSPYDAEDEPDLLHVRKHVLDRVLKAYSEASKSSEPLDVKYSRMLGLSELMSHIMNGKENGGPVADTNLTSVSQKQLRRIMYEKGFIKALTESIAEIDLNFPGAKRAVKYILRPLRTLSATAIQLSDLGLITSTPDQNDADEIESTTSVDEMEEDMDDQRDVTPDLFRNSTLGMFEPDREDDDDEEDEDEDDDEEMYEGEYDDGMDYEEDIGDAEDNISDEDEDIEGVGPMEGLDGDHALDVEVIMEDDDDEDEDDEQSSDDDDTEHDSEDDDARVEIIDEAGNVQELAEDDMDDWESDDQDDEDDADEEDYEAQAADQEEQELNEMNAMDMAGGPLGSLVRALGGAGEDPEDILERINNEEEEGIDPGEDPDRIIAGEYIEEEDDDDEDEDDEDDMDEEEMLFEQGFVDGPGRAPFDWAGEAEPVLGGGLHRRSRPGGFPPFPFFPGGPRDPLGGESERPRRRIQDLFQDLLRDLDFPNIVELRQGGANVQVVPGAFRSHRGGGPPARNGDDGVNPLLQRNSAGQTSVTPHRHSLGSFMQHFAALGPSENLIDVGSIIGRPFGERDRAAFEELMRTLSVVPGTINRQEQPLQFHMTTGPGHEIPRDIQAMFGIRGGFDRRPPNPDPSNAAFFTLMSTSARWLEEAKLLFGPSHVDIVSDLRDAIQSVLVPPAIEADKALKAAEAEQKRKAEEEAKKKAEEERIAREAKEAEERAAREKQEAEEREAAEKAAAEALAARGGEAEEVEAETTEAMEGVESENAENPASGEQADQTPTADRPRVTTIIRGNPYDITDLGIDPEFLAELPEEIREEVIMSSVAERRSAAAATGAQPSDLDQEFLDALPEDIRDEIIQQERQDRRRRERDEARRQANAANGGPQGPDDMDAANILATLPPALRQQVLMEQDEDMLALLPQEIAAQARAAQREHPHHGGRRMAARRSNPPITIQEINPQRSQRRVIVQMLEKPGIATLLRLMYIFQHGSLRQTLNAVLQNISMNRHNRNEVLSTILHILQDGSFDTSAVERSFAHLSLRAKQAQLKEKDKDPKTPQPLKRTLTGMSTSSIISPGNLEASPLMVVQQCLYSLVYLTQVNPHIPAFFLTEHEPTGGLKRNLSRKGKGKENKAARYHVNSLLSLLDRELIMESSPVMESLSTLLNMTTSPLQALQRKQKEAAEEQKNSETSQAAPNEVISTASPEAATSTEQTAETQDGTTTSEAPVATETQAPLASEGADTSTSADATVAQTESKESAKEPEKKPQRPMVPPVIPEHNLQLVINIFVARECSSKTFRETLSTIKNLSAIPGAKAVFGRELISKAQGLGEVILVDLQDLLPQIQKATTGTEIQGVALAKFSPGGSDQNKLLKVLTALDHLFDPKREKKEGSDTETEGETSQVSEKQDLLASLYENSTFGPMWEKLSECLRAIREREHMLNVATILLPLIEALMVVCKNTTLKETATKPSKDMLLTSPPPESRMENLFFTFTEEHRKILNDLVRHTPKLMSGTFSLLVKNPKVLEFDNKRNYFTRSVHNKAPSGRFPPLQLSVRREQVFHDSFKSLYFQTGDQMKYGKLSIRFHGEEGVDAGGVTREWFQVLSRQMFDPGYALFIPVSSDRTTFHPNQLSGINEEHLMFFKFIGRIIGKALYEGRVLDCHFSRAVYKRILGKPVSVKDMESLDPDYYKSLVWMLENDITDIITETFSVDNDKFGVVETIDFIENGRNIPVTEDNKHEYIRLMVEWKLTGSVKDQLDEFLKGFHDIIPAELIAIFNEQELELLISGLPEIDVDDWKSNTEYHNYSASSPQIQWFWRAVRSFDKEERAKLLQFVTGTSKVPLNGFKELEGMNGFSRFNIHRDYGNKDRLPSSHTCFNQLDLPEYESYDVLRQQVLTAITAGSSYFGFA